MSQPRMNELITGPVRGYYIAAYACPSGGEREEYAPYIKLFDLRPESYFEQIGCVLKARPRRLTNSADRALYLALVHAENMIERLPAASELQDAKHQSLIDTC